MMELESTVLEPMVTSLYLIHLLHQLFFPQLLLPLLLPHSTISCAIPIYAVDMQHQQDLKPP
jgi:hypothetical protein